MKKKRIMHGLSELAGQAWYTVYGLRNMGKDTTLVLWCPSIFSYPYDRTLNVDKSRKYMLPVYFVKLLAFFVYSLFRFDVFHFHYGRSILFTYDLWFLKLIGKQVFFEYHGSDIRNNDITYALNKDELFLRDDLGKRAVTANKRICKYADGIIFHDDELIEHLPAYRDKVYVVPLRMDLDKFKPVYPDVKPHTIRIVHAPTHRELKGTEYVLEALDRLKSEYDKIELILVEKVTQDEARSIYESADIIIDQIRIGTYGVFAIEGMALGKPVITYINDFMKERLPLSLPIVSANRDTIYDKVKMLIDDGSLRRELGLRGRQYVESYHDYRANASLMWDIYTGTMPALSGREAFDYAKRRHEAIIKDDMGAGIVEGR